MKNTGTIPEKITYYCSEPRLQIAGAAWGFDYLYKNKHKKEIVTPAAIADPLDNRTVNLAKRNAYPLLTKANNVQANCTTVQNSPIRIKFYSMSNAGFYGGSNQIKVLIDNFELDINNKKLHNLYVNLDNDVLLDLLLNCKVTNGIVDADFIWANTQSKLRLVRIGSELYNSLLDFQKKQNLSLIKKNKFEVGGVYQTKNKMRGIFLGYVDTVAFKSSHEKSKFLFSTKKINKAMLFCNLSHHEDPSLVITEKYMENDSYRFSVRETHKFVEKIDNIEIEDNLISKLREINVKKVKKCVVDYCTRNQSKLNYSIMNEGYLEYMISIHSKLMHLSKTKETPPPLFDVKKYLLFS